MAWKLTHPDSNQTIEVEAAQLALYKRAGWLTYKDKAPDVKAPPPPKKN
jgi:hypothetical protein